MDAWLMKLDAKGDTLWTRTYGGPYANDAWAVQQTRDGGYIIAGSYGVSDLPLSAPWLIKTDANGDTLWTGTYGWGDAYDVQQTFDGGYILVGHRYGQGPLLVKTDAEGDTLWTRMYNGPDTLEECYAVRQTPDSGYAVLAHGNGIWFTKIDANGDTLWNRRYWGDSSGGAAVRWNSLTATADGGFAVAALTASAGRGSNTRLIRLNENGDTLWTRAYPGESDYGFAIQQAYDGGFILAGYGSGNGTDIWLLRTDAYGDTLWTKKIGGAGNEQGRSVWQASDSGFIVAGWTKSYGGTKAYFVKLEPDHGGGIEDSPGQEGIPQSQRDPYQATIYDVNGRRIGRVPPLAAATPRRLSALLAGRLTPGVYFIHVEAGKSTHRLKTVFVR